MKLKSLLPLLLIHALVSSFLWGDLRTPAVIGSNIVLQQNHRNPIWGWGNPGETVRVSIGEQMHQAKADEKGLINNKKGEDKTIPIDQIITLDHLTNPDKK